MKLPKRIRELRKNKGLSQIKLGEIAGVSQQTVAKWENGKITPGADHLYQLTIYFGVSADYLLGITDNPIPFPEITPEEMAELEARADREAVAMTDAELAAKLPEELRDGMLALIRLERERAEAKKKIDK